MPARPPRPKSRGRAGSPLASGSTGAKACTVATVVVEGDLVAVELHGDRSDGAAVVADAAAACRIAHLAAGIMVAVRTFAQLALPDVAAAGAALGPVRVLGRHRFAPSRVGADCKPASCWADYSTVEIKSQYLACHFWYN